MASSTSTSIVGATIHSAAVSDGECWGSQAACGQPTQGWVPQCFNAATGNEWVAVQLHAADAGTAIKSVSVQWATIDTEYVGLDSFAFEVQALHSAPLRAAVSSDGLGSISIASRPAARLNALGWVPSHPWSAPLSTAVQVQPASGNAGLGYASLELWVRVLSVADSTVLAVLGSRRVELSLLAPSVVAPTAVGVRLTRLSEAGMDVADAGTMPLGWWSHVVVVLDPEGVSTAGTVYVQCVLACAWVLVGACGRLWALVGACVALHRLGGLEA